MEVSKHQRIVRPNLTWSDVIQTHMEEEGVQKEAQNCRMWRNENLMSIPQILKSSNEDGK